MECSAEYQRHMQQSDGFFQTDQLYAGDTVIFVGEKKAKEAVERFLNTEQEAGSGKGP